MAVFLRGGIIQEIRHLPDGVDLRVRGVSACRLPNCLNPVCQAIRRTQVWTKVEPTNYSFRIGDSVWWMGERLYWNKPTVSVRRLGTYRRIRDGARKPK